ncbi:site-specific DNA recombinase [Anaerobacterium chartisolvens]|uniref:Site-specific DNA recombinase n=1 Tax=Anaerobacterium chartisolvens TaxID=1297424 RepID=A0A369AG24_9FIRM|nr:recombinase family protein [Anaerobacterium chartisolvens]RCX08289.1 site-specific DNA recombinase [Anaerobacterium chartisolvens]
MKAAIYSRKSRFTGKGESVENQIQLCKEYGTVHLKIAEDDFTIYEDEGFSGGNINRPQLRKMLKDAGANKFDVIICYRLDRISRNVSDFSQLIKDLNKCGVAFVSIREQFDTSTPMGRAMMYIASVFSQLERETIAERIRDNMIQLARTGRWLGGIPPTGYKSEMINYTDSNGKERRMFKLSAIPEEINVVKLIYDKYISLKSITQVEKYLAGNNISTKNGLDFSRHSIRFILSNPVYAISDKPLYDYLIREGCDVCSGPEEFNGINGLTGYNKTKQSGEARSDRYRPVSEWILAVGLHTGIIESKRWIEAQELLEKNKSKAYRRVKSSQALLSGILRCSFCGSYMRPKAMQRKNSYGEQVFYYMCELKEKSRRSRCNISNINGNTLDASVLNELRRIIKKHPPMFEGISHTGSLTEVAVSNPQPEIGKLRARAEELDLEVQNLINAISRGQKEEVLNVILSSIEELTKEREDIKRELTGLQNVKNAYDLSEPKLELISRSLAALSPSAWDWMGVESKRRIIKSAVDRIDWDGKSIDIVLSGSRHIKSDGMTCAYRDVFPHSDNSK